VLRVLTILGAALLLFFVHDRLHVSPALIALAAATAVLLWVRPPLPETLKRVEWSVLMFFTALFVMVGGLEAAGVLDRVADLLSGARTWHPVLFGIALIWAVAVGSMVLDNVPITITLIPVLKGLEAEGIDVSALWWAVAFGAGFGGNGTIIGSTANIVVVSLSERTRTPITSHMWNRRGLPVMLMTCAVATVLYAAAYSLLSR
jgi:Na+/H+ antiporter NhaD/arsenite permease-like protein